MPRSLTDPIVLATVISALGLIGMALRAIVRQARTRYVHADSLIVPPRTLYATCDPSLRHEAARRRERVEELQRRARRASCGAPVSADVVPLRSRRAQS